MRISTGIIILAFLTVSVLGFSSIAHQAHAAHHSCLFSFSNNCATLVDPMNSVSEHLSGLQSSIQGSLNQFSISFLLLLSLLLVVIGLVSARAKPDVFRYFQKLRIRFFENLFEFKTSFLAWLSILNKREPLALTLAR